MYFHWRILSCVLHCRQVGLAAAALSGRNALCSLLSRYRSTSTSHGFTGPGMETYPHPFFAWNRPPYARSTIRWSTSMKAWLRGLAYSFVKPCPIISLSQNCLLYTSDAADDLLCVDLGGRRIIKK